ncbi:MAG: carbohydrate-binding domain-containing protein [Armatimonadota bacterium]
MPGAEQRIGALADTIRDVDPTRPVMFEGDEDPAGKADIINLHYPHEFPKWNLWPETAYWFDQTLRTDSYPNRDWHWDRKKPLYLGEFLWVPDREVDAPSIFLGEAAYPDVATAHRQAKAQAWEAQVIAARDAGVGGMCPWNLWEMGEFPNVGSDAHRRAYQPIAAFVRESGTEAYAGSTVRRTFMVFNDSGAAHTLELHWRLASADGTWQTTGRRTLTLTTAQRTRVAVDLTVPQTREEMTPARFTYELWEGDQRRFGESQEWEVFCRRRPPAPASLLQVAVCERGGEVTRVLAQMGLKALSFAEADTQALSQVHVAVIGKGVFQGSTAGRVQVGRQDTFPAALAAFVRRGATLLVLEQTAYPSSLIPVLLSSHDSTVVFIAQPDHPALRGMTPNDFAHWGLDGSVGRREIVKPDWGGFLPLVHSGGERGLETAGLAELRLGAGRLLLCQLDVTANLGREPAADRLLQNLLAYAAQPPAETKPTAALCDDTTAAALSTTGLQFTRLTSLAGTDLSRFGQLILGDPQQAAASAISLRRFVQAGGRVLLHDVTSDVLPAVQQLLGQPMTLTEGCDGAVRLTEHRGPAAGISAQDLAWFGPMPSDEFSAPSLLPTLARSTLGRPATPAGSPTRVEAEVMRLTCPAAAREALPDGACVALYTNGELATDITVPAAGPYELALRLRGTPADGAYPRVTVSVDGASAGSVSAAADWRTVGVLASLSAGAHTLRVAFTNDLVSGAEDRNLWVDWVAWTPVTLPATPLVFHTDPGVLVSLPDGQGLWVIDQVRWQAAAGNEDKATHYLSALLAGLSCAFAPESGETVEAAAMAVTAELSDRTGEGVTLATAGTLDCEADFATSGRYVFGLRASGTAVDGIYPRVELRVDGATVGTFELLSGNWRTYRLTTPVAAGVHHVTLAYVNDEWRPPEDRNLSVARLTIQNAEH